MTCNSVKDSTSSEREDYGEVGYLGGGQKLNNHIEHLTRNKKPPSTT